MKNIKGFTLVEVLATIVILGILLLIAVPSVSKLQETSNIRQIEADAKIFVELVRQKIESDTSLNIDNTNNVFSLSSIDVTKLSSSKYENNLVCPPGVACYCPSAPTPTRCSSVTVDVSSCDYVNDIYSCSKFSVSLMNENYKAIGSVNGNNISITGSKG